MRWGRALGPATFVLAVFGLATGASASLAQAPVPGNTAAAATPADIPHTQPKVDIAERLLAIQNAERAKRGVPPLVWSKALADDANQYAQVLLKRGTLEHSQEASRSGKGENLWMGTAGAFSIDNIVDMFLEERRYFHSAAFPNVSLTGNWTDVGHYSQIVWKDTKEVGCALESANGMDVLVCRYFPAGNVYGTPPLSVP